MGELKPFRTQAGLSIDALARRIDEAPDRPVYACDTCSDTGWKPLGAGVTRCECRPTQMYADDVPYEFQQASFDNYDVQEGNKVALARAKIIMAGTRDLFLCGGVGAGKTRLACTVLNEEYRASGRRVGWFVRVPMMLYRLQPGTGLSEEDRSAYEHRLFHAPLVCLDDVGAERDVATDYTRRMLLMVYEERGDKGLRTIWTSNKTPQQLSEMQNDDRIASRIAGRCDVVTLSTPDQRLARRKR